MVLAKTLRIDDDTLEIISQMRWSEDGLQGVIEQQLDAADYRKVKKALEALGGSWSKKEKAHLFPADPRTQVQTMLNAGKIEVPRDGFFRTPRPVVMHMLDLVPLPEHSSFSVLEPSAGDGAIIDVISQVAGSRQPFTFAIELNPQRFEAMRQKAYGAIFGDFLQFRPHPNPPVGDNSCLPYFDRVYMNPPFEEGQDIRHVVHAYSFVKLGGWLCAVMGEGAFFRNDKLASMFRGWVKAVGAQSVPLPPKSFHESGTDVNTRILFVKRG